MNRIEWDYDIKSSGTKHLCWEQICDAKAKAEGEAETRGNLLVGKERSGRSMRARAGDEGETEQRQNTRDGRTRRAARPARPARGAARSGRAPSVGDSIGVRGEPTGRIPKATRRRASGRRVRAATARAPRGAYGCG